MRNNEASGLFRACWPYVFNMDYYHGKSVIMLPIWDIADMR